MSTLLFLVIVFFWLFDGLPLFHCIDHVKWYWNKITGWGFFTMAAKVVGSNYSFGRMILNWFMDGDWYQWIIWTRGANGTQIIRYASWSLQLIILTCGVAHRKQLQAIDENQWNKINLKDLLSMVTWFGVNFNGIRDMSATNNKVTIVLVVNGGSRQHIDQKVQARYGPGILTSWLNLTFMKIKGVQRWDWWKGQQTRCLVFRMEIHRSSLSPQFPARWSLI